MDKEERTAENKMERCLPTIIEMYWSESGRGDGQGDVEKNDQHSYRRPYMIGKAWGGERRRRCDHEIRLKLVDNAISSTIAEMYYNNIFMALWRNNFQKANFRGMTRYVSTMDIQRNII